MSPDSTNPKSEEANRLDESEMEKLAEIIASLLLRELEFEAERSGS